MAHAWSRHAACLFHILGELPGHGHGEGEARYHAEEHVVVVGAREVYVAWGWDSKSVYIVNR